MAFSLPFPPPFDAQGWKAKIRDRERSDRKTWDDRYPENPINSQEDADE